MASQSLPTVLYTLTCLSFCFSTAIFILALLDAGLLSLWIDAAFATVTILYHIAVIAMAYRNKNKCPLKYPTIFHTTTSVTWAFFILTMWIIAFGITTEAAVNGPGSLMASEQHAPWNQGILVSQSIMTALESVWIGVIAIYCIVKKNKSDLEKQACLDEKKFYVSQVRTTVVWIFLPNSAYLVRSQSPPADSPVEWDSEPKLKPM